MKNHINALLESFRSDTNVKYEEHYIEGEEDALMWNSAPNIHVFLHQPEVFEEGHAVVILSGQISEHCKQYFNVSTFYPATWSATGVPWEHLLSHLESSGGLTETMFANSADARLLRRKLLNSLSTTQTLINRIYHE